MKLIHTLTSLSILGLSPFALAGEECASKSCHKEKTATVSTSCKEGCDDADKCPESCDSEGTSAKYVVTGMTCGSCSDKVKTTLAAVEGVKSCSVCHKSGHVTVNYNESKTDKTKVQAALAATGFTVTGEELSIPVSGMTCGGCTKKVTAALNAVEGCKVGSVCHKSGHATITIDPTKTSEAKIIEAINATGFKVANKEKIAVEAPAKS